MEEITNIERVSGHGEKLGRRRELAIAALLQAPTVAEAAVMVGVAEATMLRWLRLRSFSEEYDAARREVLDGAVIELQSLSGAAVSKLRELLSCGNRMIELRAAVAILEHGYRARELDEHEERIRTLERMAREQEEARLAMEREDRLAAGN